LELSLSLSWLIENLKEFFMIRLEAPWVSWESLEWEIEAKVRIKAKARTKTLKTWVRRTTVIEMKKQMVQDKQLHNLLKIGMDTRHFRDKELELAEQPLTVQYRHHQEHQHLIPQYRQEEPITHYRMDLCTLEEDQHIRAEKNSE
jgi:hypothetical protein